MSAMLPPIVIATSSFELNDGPEPGMVPRPGRVTRGRPARSYAVSPPVSSMIKRVY
jgi:hypothetical protein